MEFEYINKVILRGIVGSSKFETIDNKEQVAFTLITYDINEDDNNTIQSTFHCCYTILNNKDYDKKLFQRRTILEIEGKLKTARYNTFRETHFCSEIFVEKITKVEH